MPDNVARHFDRTRIAPTPSGFLHLGNALSFALTAALSKKTDAKILLRIDDLDQARVNDTYVQDIFDTLNFLSIPWDEGPRDMADYTSNWSQLHRMDIYMIALQQLQQTGAVFACECSRSQLQLKGNSCICRNRSIPLNTPGTAWRLYTDDRPLYVKTLNEGTVIPSLPDDMKDFIVKKKDGYPAYQLASLVDDVQFDVDLIIRGQDLYPSTLAQLYLADILKADGFKNATFHHHPLLMENGEKKLSKSAGATSIKYLREQGKSAEDVYGELSGWLLNK